MAASQVTGGGRVTGGSGGWGSATDAAGFKAAMSEIFGNDGCRDEGFALFECGRGDGSGLGGDGDFGGAEAAGGFGEGGVGASVGPAAAEGDVDAEA